MTAPERLPRRGEGLPYWRAVAPPERLRALEVASRDRLPSRPDVAVIGGGVLGLAIAAMCVRAGLGEVVVFERGQLAGGPSGRAGGVLAPEAHAWTDPPSLVALGRHSLALTRRLDAEWDRALGVRELDCLLVGRRIDDATTPPSATVDVLDAGQIREREPAVRGAGDGVFIREQGHVDPLRFAAGLASHAGTVATGVSVGAATVRRGRVVTLHTSGGDVHPGVVVYATGSAPPGMVPVAHRAIKGHLAVTEPIAGGPCCQVVAPDGGALPLADGRVLTGGTLDEGDTAPGVRPAVVERIRRGLAAVVPGAAATPFSHVWTCYRPAAPDRLPLIDRLPGADNAWFTSGHYRTGLLMAAATGDVIVRWVTTGKRPGLAESFALARLSARPGGEAFRAG